MRALQEREQQQQQQQQQQAEEDEEEDDEEGAEAEQEEEKREQEKKSSGDYGREEKDTGAGENNAPLQAGAAVAEAKQEEAAAEQRLTELKPQEFANTIWAFAKVNYRDGKPLAAHTEAAERRLW